MPRAVLLLAVTCLAFAPAPFPRQRRADDGLRDLRAMQGTWTERFADSAAVTILGNRMEYHPDHAWKLKLNARTNPRRIEAAGVGPAVAGQVRRGIYRVENGKLIICWGKGAAGELEWPASLDPFHKDVWIEVFTLVKP